MNDAFSGLSSLVRFTTFLDQYQRVFDTTKERLGVEGFVDYATAAKAHEIFLGEYFQIIEKKSRKAIFNRSIVALVNATASAERFMPQKKDKPKLASYLIQEDKNKVVEIDIRYILRLYSDEMTGILFGATIFSMEMQRKTKKGPTCKLEVPHVVEAAKVLRTSPISVGTFLKLIGNPPVL